MELHGCGEAAEQLSALASHQQWADMADLVSDEMLNTFATVAEEDELAAALQERYAGLADRLTLYTPFVPGERDAFWHQLVKDFH
jgi:hypothetical protein